MYSTGVGRGVMYSDAPLAALGVASYHPKNYGLP